MPSLPSVPGVTGGTGRAGLVCKSGSMTDLYIKGSFPQILSRRWLAGAVDFEESQKLFPDVDSREKPVRVDDGCVCRGARSVAFFLNHVGQNSGRAAAFPAHNRRYATTQSTRERALYSDSLTQS